MEKILNYTVLFEPAEEGGYIVRIPALDGLTTQGETLKGARAMARDAIKCYCESLLKDNLPLPRDVAFKTEPVIEKLEVRLAFA